MERTIVDDMTVVIPTLGRPILEHCLEAIAAGSRWPARLIVVDQADDPEIVPTWLAKLPGGLDTAHVRAPRRGAGAARNRAFERVRTARLAAIDDDCLVDGEWLEHLDARLGRHRGAIVTGQVRALGSDATPSTQMAEESTVHERPPVASDPLYTGNMGLELATAQRVGPFDESPLLRAAAEDNDWGYRALRAGIPIVYAPEVIVTHADGRDAVRRAEVYRAYAYGQGAFYGKYIRRGDGFMAYRAARDLLRGPLRWLRGVLHHDAELVASGRAYTRYLMPGLWRGLRGQDL